MPVDVSGEELRSVVPTMSGRLRTPQRGFVQKCPICLFLHVEVWTGFVALACGLAAGSYCGA